RTALREQIGTIGFASATAGAFHAQNPANAIANLVDAIDPADPSSNIARYYRALDNTLRNSDRVTLHRLPDGVVRVVAQRVAHDQDGALLHRRGNPVTISATILLRPAQDGVLATVESLQARPDRSMRGHGQPLASRKRVLEAVAATESGLAVEVDAETLFPALDKPNTIVIKPLGADAFDAAVDFDSQTGKLVVTAAGMTVHTSVNAAKNAPDGQLLRAVEAALADAVAQLQAKKLGRPESAFSIENVLRAGPVLNEETLTWADLTVADHGRMARLRTLYRQYLTAPRPERVRMRAELHGMIDSLGLRQGQPGSEKRRELLAPGVLPLVVELGGAERSRFGFFDTPLGVQPAGRTFLKNLVPDAVGVAALAGLGAATGSYTSLISTGVPMVVVSVGLSAIEVWLAKRRYSREEVSERLRSVREKEHIELRERAKRGQWSPDGSLPELPIRRRSYNELISAKLRPSRRESVLPSVPAGSLSALRYITAKLKPYRPGQTFTAAEQSQIANAMPWISSAPGLGKAAAESIAGMPMAGELARAGRLHARAWRAMRVEELSGQISEMFEKADRLLRQLSRLHQSASGQQRVEIENAIGRLRAVRDELRNAYRTHVVPERARVERGLSRPALRRGLSVPVTDKAPLGIPSKRAFRIKEIVPGTVQALATAAVVQLAGVPAFLFLVAATPIVAAAISAWADRKYQQDRVADRAERRMDLQRKQDQETLRRFDKLITALGPKFGAPQPGSQPSGGRQAWWRKPAEGLPARFRRSRPLGQAGQTAAQPAAGAGQASAEDLEVRVATPRLDMFIVRQVATSLGNSGAAGFTVWLLTQNPVFGLFVGAYGVMRGVARGYMDWHEETYRNRLKEDEEEYERGLKAEARAAKPLDEILADLDELADEAGGLDEQITLPDWVDDKVRRTHEALAQHGATAVLRWFTTVITAYGESRGDILDKYLDQFGGNAADRALGLHRRYDETLTVVAKANLLLEPATELLLDHDIEFMELAPWSVRRTNNSEWIQLARVLHGLPFPRKTAPWLHAAAIQFALQNGALVTETDADGNTVERADLAQMAHLIEYFGQRVTETTRGRRALTSLARGLDDPQTRRQFFEEVAAKLRDGRDAANAAQRATRTIPFENDTAAAYQVENPANRVLDLPEALAGRGYTSSPASRYHRALQATLRAPELSTERLLDNGDIEVLHHRVSRWRGVTTRDGFGRPIVMTAHVIRHADGSEHLASFSARPDRGLAREIAR
ncbi:MAG: hypothetical protein ACRDT8_08270, partial [Micromonosporaceae bacterium]